MSLRDVVGLDVCHKVNTVNKQEKVILVYNLWCKYRNRVTLSILINVSLPPVSLPEKAMWQCDKEMIIMFSIREGHPLAIFLVLKNVCS